MTEIKFLNTLEILLKFIYFFGILGPHVDELDRELMRFPPGINNAQPISK